VAILSTPMKSPSVGPSRAAERCNVRNVPG
jgi:hypothetical protein